ncbi:MAG TPA: hypothetical protein VL547_00945 [Dinghuibacter sp.]|uniref:hypothetical protein n=2 Tax=Dinghuibacter sp. TaxID=2024697 RepID=UPI002CE7040B|nr:hypothetical protein [Dinghuibacter sp.]HTJ10554.1 hypothetical protein [Dinghuibacter sp.]
MTTGNRIAGVLLLLLTVAVGRVHAQDEDLIGFKGGYKALSRLCEQNLDGAARLLANDYSRGYFVSLSIPAGTDTVADISFLTATPPEMARQIAWAMRGTNGQWMRRPAARKLLIPIFFCQNAPPNDSLFSQLLVTNNVGFSVPRFPDQWPEAAEGVWIHPICPLVPNGTPRQAPAPVASAPAPAPTTTAPTTTTAPAPTYTTPPTPAKTAPAYTPQPTPPPVAAAPAAPTYDTTSASGIFKAKVDFDGGVVIYGNNFPIEEKGLLSWYPIDYAAYGTVRARTSPTAKDYQEFPLGDIYGFKSNNISFAYIKSNKEYLAVIAKGGPFYLLLDERKQTGYNGSNTIDGIFMYARSLDGQLKEFTRKNIDAEFGSNPQMAADMQSLRKELNKHCVSMTRGDFEACRELAKDYLAKWPGH